MNHYEAHSVRADYDEAVNLLHHMTLEEIEHSRNMYEYAYKSENSSDHIWNSATGLLGVYALGFLSGARAIRERNTSKTNHKGG